MAEKKRYKLLQILANVLWVLLGAGTIVLLVAAIKKKENKHCRSVNINISGVQNNFFIDKNDVINILEDIGDGKLVGRAVSSFHLANMESVLEKNYWIKSAELFFDNNEVLRINILEREPIARIFTIAGSSFYIDTSVARLPLSDKFSARLPVFTNFPAFKIPLSGADSNLLISIKNISEYIMKDSFWMAMIDQVDITPQRGFEMIPKIGNQVINFGNAGNYIEKFNNLLLFYKKVQSRIGWDKYSVINVQYKGQVVCIKRGAADIKMDSLKAKQLMITLVANAQKQANDSLSNIQLVQQDDDFIPLPSQTDDDIPADDETIYKQLLNIKAGKSQVKDTPINPAVVPENSLPATASQPIDQNSTIKKILPKVRSKSFKKQNHIPVKKNYKVKIFERPDTKPKAIMPPKNDY